MNNTEKNEELKGLEINIKTEIEIKEEPLENYSKDFCDEELLNSDSLKPQEQTNEASINNSSSVYPHLPIKLENEFFKINIGLNPEVELEHDLLDERERRMENVTDEECDVERENNYEVNKEGVHEESRDVPPDTGKKTKSPFLSLNVNEEIQFDQLEASEFPKIIVQRVNVEVEKNKLKNMKTIFNERRKVGSTFLSLNSSKVENKKQKTMNFNVNKRNEVDEMEACCSQQSHISSTFSSVSEFQAERVRDLNGSLANSNNKLLKCSECDYSCNKKNRLKIHLLTHSDTKLFKCSECDYSCNRKNYLKIHSLTHSNTKLFKCSECDFSCNFKGNLKRHLWTHATIYGPLPREKA